MKFNGVLGDAIKEYERCLKMRKTISDNEESDRAIAEVHYSLAVTHIYYAAEMQKDDPVLAKQLKQRALHHYRDAVAVSI